MIVRRKQPNTQTNNNIYKMHVMNSMYQTLIDSHNHQPTSTRSTRLSMSDVTRDDDSRSNSNEAIARSLQPNQTSPTVCIHVSGFQFKIQLRTLHRHPDTRLGHIGKLIEKALYEEVEESLRNHVVQEVRDLCDDYSPEKLELKFDRSPYAFDAILNFYRSYSLHIPEGQCPISFLSELRYWCISRNQISKCCVAKIAVCDELASMAEQVEISIKNQRDRNSRSLTPGLNDSGSVVTDGDSMMNGQKSDTRANYLLHHGVHCDLDCYESMRAHTWQCLEDPKSSFLAIIFSITSLSFVVATMVILIMSSIPEYQYKIFDNVTNTTETFVDQNLENGDIVCIGWFTLEHVLRIWAAPNRCAYLKSPLCNIDLLSIAPFYIELILKMLDIENKMFAELRRSLIMMRILRALRVMRVLRVLKVARYSKGFQSVGTTLKKCWRELIMLVLFMFTTNVMFSTVMYFLENDVHTPGFESIPAASWWCIITMTTVGYGDVYPMTIPGKIFASFISITGIILLAFPISVIVENFHEQYSEATGLIPTTNTEETIVKPPSESSEKPVKRSRIFTGLFMSDVKRNQYSQKKHRLLRF